jgi:hypothetical protein
MSIEEIKSNFHNLIDDVNDMDLLKNYYEGLYISVNKRLQNELSEEGKKKILQAYEESEIESNLIDNDVVKEKINKRLLK